MFDLLDNLFDALDKFLDDLDVALEEIEINVSNGDKERENKSRKSGIMFCGGNTGFFCG